MDFVNTNPHPARIKRVRDGKPDELVRVLPGQVVQADGAFADAVRGTAGFREADDEDRENARRLALEALGTPSEGPADSRIGIDAALSASVDLRRALIAAPLQRVIGDDAAPAGPPSGAITTKIGAQDSPLGQRSYGENEAPQTGRVEGAGLPDPNLPLAATPSHAEVHNAQVEAALAADEVARQTVAPPGREGGSASVEVSEPYEDVNVDALLAEADRRGLAVEGTGRGGNVKKEDVVRALREADQNAEQEEQ